MQRGPLRPRSRPPLRPLAVCIKCTHGDLSMPAAGLTLKMRERARPETASSADLAFVQPGQRVASRDEARALSKLKAAADEQQREREGGGGGEAAPEADRAASSLIFTNVETHFCCHFQHFSHLTDPLTGRPVQAPGTVFIMVWLSSFALHATCRINKQQFPTVYW